MVNARRAAAQQEPGPDLHVAPRIARGHDRGAGFGNAGQLRREHGLRHVGLEQVVDPGRSAALIGVLQWYLAAACAIVAILFAV